MMMVDRRSLVLALVLVERVKNKFDLIDFFFQSEAFGESTTHKRHISNELLSKLN